MPDAKEGNSKTYDPFEPFRGVRDAYLDAMAKAMIEAVNSESYAQATGAMLDCYLTASAPFRETMEKAMLQTLQQLSLPSRQEVAVLAERFTNLEMRLDEMDAKLDRILNAAARVDHKLEGQGTEAAVRRDAKPAPKRVERPG